MPPPSDIRTLIWEETLAADMRQRYFHALAANAASLNAGLRAALPLTTLITFLSAAGVFLTQWTIPLSVIAFAAGLLAAIVTDGSARAEGDVGAEGRVGFRGFVGAAVPESRGVSHIRPQLLVLVNHGLQILLDGPAFGGRAAPSSGDHAGGFPVAGQHDFRGGRAARRQFGREPDPATVRRHARLDAGGADGGGAKGADRLRGAVLQIPHVGGVPLVIRFRGPHGEQHAVAVAGVRHVTPFKRAHFRPPQPAHEQQAGDHGVESAPAVRRGVGFDAPAVRAGPGGGGENRGEPVRAQRGGLAPAPVGGRAPVAAQHAGGRCPGGGRLALSDPVVFDVRLPPGAGPGPAVDRPALREAGRVSSPAFRIGVAVPSATWIPGRTSRPVRGVGGLWIGDASRYQVFSARDRRRIAFGPESTHRPGGIDDAWYKSADAAGVVILDTEAVDRDGKRGWIVVPEAAAKAIRKATK